MFTQISLSIDSNNYVIQLELNDVAIRFINANKKSINKLKLLVSDNDISTDEYNGELFGLAFTDKTSDEMLKKTSSIVTYFSKNNINVMSVKKISLGARIEQLELIDKKNHLVINGLAL